MTHNGLFIIKIDIITGQSLTSFLSLPSSITRLPIVPRSYRTQRLFSISSFAPFQESFHANDGSCSRAVFPFECLGQLDVPPSSAFGQQ